MLILIILLLFIILAHSVHNWFFIVKKNKYIDHRKNAIVFSLITIASFVGLGAWGDIHYIVILAALVMVPSIRWIFFDVWLNLFRGLPWDYVDVVDDGDKDSLTDTFLRKINVHPMIIKLTFLGLSIVVSMMIMDHYYHIQLQ